LLRIMNEQFDYIIVGAGTAGCLLANRLSADRSKRVLLLEAGGEDNYIWIHIPVGYLYCIGNPRTDWLFNTEPEAGLNGRSIRYPRGKVFGGCSSINGMIYMRGQRGDYDGWSELGNSGWSWEDVLPYFIQHEDYHKLDEGGRDALHGHGGEWRIEKPRISWEILDAFRDAAEELGIPKSEDFNRGDNFGCGYFEVNQKSGVRWNASKAFLRPALGRSNLKVVSHAHVTRVRLRSDGSRRVEGVDYVVRDSWAGQSTIGASSSGTSSGTPSASSSVQVSVDCAREVVMSAGAVHTPAILQLSGIGPAADLRSVGIMPCVDLPGVGGNLQDHLQLRMIYQVSGVKTLNVQIQSLFQKAWMGAQYALMRRGPLTMAPSQLGAFARSDPSLPFPDLEYHVQPLSLDKFGEPLHSFPAITASVCHLRPSSRGSIRLGSPDVFAAPKIAPNYLSTEGDRLTAARAIRLTREIVAGKALARYCPEEFLPGARFQSDLELAGAASQIGTTIFHPVGTCKMGPNSDPNAVVDSQLRCHGISGLRIADASVMPTITSGNTNSPTLMIAERAAHWILTER
jgi:choline dehydrogenase